MKYQSTRSNLLVVSSSEAILDGLASDGGLYAMPTLTDITLDWRAVLNLDTQGMATEILSALLPDFSREEMALLVRRAYDGKFETEDLTPSAAVGEDTVLELFRGPTSAFKDVALSMLPHLITAARDKLGVRDEILILTATSGDTGKAAMEGFRDVEGTRIIVFYPANGVSAVQRAQMVTQEGRNVCAAAVRGNFDDAQTGVKSIFSAVSREQLLEGKGIRLSSANSINIGRLAPQVVYYFRAYADLAAAGRIQVGDAVDFVVPTGNFGDILAGYFAKGLGLPVGTLVCASNANDVLTEFFRTGCYNRRRPFYQTASPSMDILVSSNLERLLFLTTGDAAFVSDCMARLAQEGSYRIPDALKARLDREFWAGSCCDSDAAASIGQIWREHHYLCDTHTAVAWNVAQQYKAAVHPTNPLVILSTASPYKFPAAVLRAIGRPADGDEFDVMRRLHDATGVPVPVNLQGLENREIRHTDTMETGEMLSYVLRKAGESAWNR